jgi:hypothetical protein
MPEFDVEAFIAELDRMGMKLTALQLADGKLKVYRWRMQGAREHAAQIEALWNLQVGENQVRIDLLAEHIIRVDKAKYEAPGNYTTKPRADE